MRNEPQTVEGEVERRLSRAAALADQLRATAEALESLSAFADQPFSGAAEFYQEVASLLEWFATREEGNDPNELLRLVGAPVRTVVIHLLANGDYGAFLDEETGELFDRIVELRLLPSPAVPLAMATLYEKPLRMVGGRSATYKELWRLKFRVQPEYVPLVKTEQPSGSSTERARADAAPQNSASQPKPPPAVLGPNHADGCKGNLAYYSGDGYDRVRVCQCGAEDHEPARREQAEQPPGSTAGSAAPTGSMDAGSTPAPGATEQIDRRLSFRGEPTRGNAASLPGAGQSASSPCPPPAFTEVERVVEWIRSEWPRGGDRVDYLVDLVKRLDPPGSAESDARALEHVGKLLQSECIKQTSPEALLRRASALRAAAPESEPDVFESFGLAADEDDSGRFEGREHRISADARNWFGDILRLAKQAQSDETMSESWRYAFALALSALRRRAQEASA